MENVTQLNKKQQLLSFFETMFGQQTGYVYSGTKTHDQNEKWTKNFFHWPNEKDKLVDHILDRTISEDVYFCPSLFKRPAYHPESITRDHFYGSYWLWVDFDYGNIPDAKRLAELNIPAPTIRIRSSERKRQHWYWRLDLFQTDVDVLESLNKRITYALEADMGGWDYQQSLRPPGTIHQKSQKTVLMLNQSTSFYPVSAFDNVPEPPSNAFEDIEIENVPEATKVLFKYALPDDTVDLFTKKVDQLNVKHGAKKADRSDALMRLGYDFAEAGMSNEEIYACLKNADDRWGKFKVNKHSNPERQYVNLIKIIRRARIKVPLTNPDDLISELPIYNWVDFLNTEVKIDWSIKDLIHKKGRVTIASLPGVGKTQLTMWMLAHIAIGKSTLIWEIERPMKIVFYSMEMGHADLKYLVDQFNENFTEEERELLKKNFIIIPLGYSIPLDKTRGQELLKAVIEKIKPDGVAVDSLGVAVDDNISSDVVINNTYRFIDREIRNKHGCFFWFIHHMRKEQIGNKQPKKLSDLYGSQYIGSNADTVIGLWQHGSGRIEVNCLKLRLAKPFNSFKVERTSPLGFEIADSVSSSELAGFSNILEENVEDDSESDDGIFDI